MEKIGIFGGSFNPPHIGHIQSAAYAADCLGLTRLLLVPTWQTPGKTAPDAIPAQRLEMLRRSVADLPNVEAELFRGLLADYAREKDARIIVKGLRNATDFDQEYQMAAINRGIWADLETVFLPASIAYQHFSSTMVREMIRYGQPLEKYVPLPVTEELKHHLSN